MLFRSLSFSLCVVSQTTSCCGTDLGGGNNNQYWYLITPADTQTECHKNINDPDYASPTFQGWAFESNGCHLNSGSCNSLVGNLGGQNWCDEDDDAYFLIDDDDDNGFGSNTPADLFTDVVANGACGNEETITRTWFSDSSCSGVGRLTSNQIIRIRDTRAPTIAMPADHTFECTDFPAFSDEFGFADAFDVCNTVIHR